MSQNVRIANKLPQVVEVSILDADGKPIALRLAPNGESAVLPKDRLTSHVNALAAKGHVRIRPA